MSASSHVFGVKQSILGQPWRWRGGAADGLELTGIETQLYLSRGCPHDDLERHRTPTIRAWMPDPSIFHDMEPAARRIAAALEAGQALAFRHGPRRVGKQCVHAISSRGPLFLSQKQRERTDE